MTQTVVHVEGMTCGGCANAVKSALAELGAEALIQLDTKQVTVTHPEQVTWEQIKDAIEERGFDVLK